MLFVFMIFLFGCKNSSNISQKKQTYMSQEEKEIALVSATAILDVVNRYKNLDSIEVKGYTKFEDVYIEEDKKDRVLILSKYINNNNKNIIIAIRGTINKFETEKDFDANYAKFRDYSDKFKYKYGLTHGGFYKMYKKIRAGIVDDVKQCKDCNIIITGHSLGAAIASLATYDIMIMKDKLNIDNVINLYAYAPPKIGNDILQRNFARLLKKNKKGQVLFIINKNDIVPKTPTYPMYFPYPIQYIKKLCWNAKPLNESSELVEVLTRNHHLADYITALRRDFDLPYKTRDGLEYCSNQ